MKTILNVMLILMLAVSAFVTAQAKTSKVKTIKVNISSKGYTPGAIKIKKGEKVRLLLTRTDAQNCGGEIVFASLNIRKELPVGKTVTVEFMAQDAGEINFSCGMGMMKGKILVQ